MQKSLTGLKRKAGDMSGGSFGSAISRGSLDGGTSADSKARSCCPPLRCRPTALCLQTPVEGSGSTGSVVVYTTSDSKVCLRLLKPLQSFEVVIWGQL